jgi:hypothetical protein
LLLAPQRLAAVTVLWVVAGGEFQEPLNGAISTPLVLEATWSIHCTCPRGPCQEVLPSEDVLAMAF